MDTSDLMHPRPASEKCFRGWGEYPRNTQGVCENRIEGRIWCEGEGKWPGREVKVEAKIKSCKENYKRDFVNGKGQTIVKFKIDIKSVISYT